MKNLDEFFKHTISFVLEPTETEFNVARDISKFLPTKEEGGKIDHLDFNIKNRFGKVTIKGRKEKIVSNLYRLLKDLTYSQIIGIGERFQIYKSYNLFDAIELAQKLIDAGEIERNTGVSIYLKEQYNNSVWWLLVNRLDNGKLYVRLFELYFSDEVSVGSGAGFL